MMLSGVGIILYILVCIGFGVNGMNFTEIYNSDSFDSPSDPIITEGRSDIVLIRESTRNERLDDWMYSERVQINGLDKRIMDLQLYINNKLTKNLQVVKHGDNGTAPPTVVGRDSDGSCVHMYSSGEVIAALTRCSGNSFNGLLTMNGTVYEIESLEGPKNYSPIEGRRHLMREIATLENAQENFNRRVGRDLPVKTMEIGIFVDSAAYNALRRLLTKDDYVVDVILGLLNNVQAIFSQPSLGRQLDLSIVQLNLLTKQPSVLPTHNGERWRLLKSFCKYASKKNPNGEANPQHWDVALLVSGLNFWGYINGRKDSATLGLANTGGICSKTKSCVIAEFGSKNFRGRPYPSAGFLSSYVIAHELGHSRNCLDDTPDDSVMLKQDHTKYDSLPGQSWNAHQQCKLFLKDNDAMKDETQNIQDICNGLRCTSHNIIGSLEAGPALDGTFCGRTNWCIGGSCTPWNVSNPLPTVVRGDWSEWKSEGCKSGCLTQSVGVTWYRRHCDGNMNTQDSRCWGEGRKARMCEQNKICGNKSVGVVEYASKQCKKFKKYMNDLAMEGKQFPYEEANPWKSCSIYCRVGSSNVWRVPRWELSHTGVPVHFPDGTWCHQKRGRPYYCQNGICDILIK